MNQDPHTGENPQKKSRRNKVEIQKSLYEAASKIIEQSGFPGLTITCLMHKANLNPIVFYKRYKDIDDFIEKYVRSYDYWLRDTISITPKSNNPVEKMVEILDELIDSLIENIPMQKLIAWEMNEKNHITNRTAQARDITCIHLIDYFNDALKHCAIKFDYTLSLIIGGIYYLVIHRELGTFNHIDFSKKESIDKLKESLHHILYKLFDDFSTPTDNIPKVEDQSIEDVARELIKSNVDYRIIKKATKLSDYKLKKLYT